MRKLFYNKLNENIFEALIGHSFDGIGILDRNGVIKYTSDMVTKILGFDPNMVIGKSCFDFIDREDLNTLKEIFQSVLNSEGGFIETELRLKKKNGDIILCEVNIKNLLKNRMINGIVIYFREAASKSFDQSIERDELLVDYLLKLHLENGDISTAEALIRREHPELTKIINSINQIDIVNKDIRRQFLLFINSSKVIKKSILPTGNGIGKKSMKSATKEKAIGKLNLTMREMEVLDKVITGCSNKEIADLLHISVHTVKNHMTKVLRKLGVSDRSQAIAKIYQMGNNSRN
ncbi:LuxR C-terminal-related transcriptional regulator [Sporosarcina sp. FA9]|uniref:response regulator transcription factor n=1 Tax=Sporosarcina sp. FA9 TaxID=3413030 RepID=UPI003F65B1C7